VAIIAITSALKLSGLAFQTPKEMYHRWGCHWVTLKILLTIVAGAESIIFMFSHPWVPAIAANIVMTRMSLSKCCFVRSTLGSGMSSK